jgi:hypothetical protein
VKKTVKKAGRKGPEMWHTREECADVLGCTVQNIDVTLRPCLPPWATKTEGHAVLLDLAVITWLHAFKKTGHHPRDRCPHCGEPIRGSKIYPPAERTLADWDGKNYCD